MLVEERRKKLILEKRSIIGNISLVRQLFAFACPGFKYLKKFCSGRVSNKNCVKTS